MYRADECIESEREGRADSFDALIVPHIDQAVLQQLGPEKVPLCLVIQDAFRVVGRQHKHFLQFPLIVDITIVNVDSSLRSLGLIKDVCRLVYFHHETSFFLLFLNL